MSERTPINPEDIREGDTIRFEPHDKSAFLAREWIADRHELSFVGIDGRHYLLDRPKPAVELPTEPTLGWATGTDKYRNVPRRALGSWSLGQGGGLLNRTENTWPDPNGSMHLLAATVTSFTPAVAVPKAALEELMLSKAHADADVQIFLAAIDAANGGDGR